MISETDLKRAIEEANRFLDGPLEALADHEQSQKRQKKEGPAYYDALDQWFEIRGLHPGDHPWPPDPLDDSVTSATLKRRSMDLSNALVALRRRG